MDVASSSSSRAEPRPLKIGELEYIPPPTPPAATAASTRAPSPPPKPPHPTRTLHGIALKTLLKLLLHLFFLTGTIASWILLVRIVSVRSKADGISVSGTASVFVHVAFAIAALMQLIFLERVAFRIRAERYAFKHPEDIESGGSRRRGMGIAPWNRPPIPTYAAAIREGAEDGEPPPPPAYGHTRGSMLMLSGFLTETQREQRPRDAGSRPTSYSADLEADWQERTDAERALALEETLARLESDAL